jgi:urease accessory protein UreH
MADHVIGWHQEDDAWRAGHLRDRTSAVVETELVVRLESGAVAPRITTIDARNTALRAAVNRHKV